MVWSSDFGEKYAKKSKTKKILMFFGNSQLSIEHEKSKFSILFLKNRNLPTVRFSCFLDRFISTFSHRNHSAKFRGLKLSTKNSLLTILERTVSKASKTLVDINPSCNMASISGWIWSPHRNPVEFSEYHC